MNRGLSLDICIFGCSMIVLKEYGRNPVQFRHGRPFIGAGYGQSWAITGVVCLTRLAGSMRLDVAIYMGYINGAVVGIPFAPPTLGRFYLPSAGVWLKLSRLHITLSWIIELYILFAACYSLCQLHSLYSCILSRAVPMYSAEIHLVWRRQHSASLSHDITENETNWLRS